jgi:ABC-type sugar transport system ATPase subunit
LYPPIPKSLYGKIKIRGVDIYDPSVDVIELRKRVGMVFQKSNPFPKSIYENITYGLRLQGRSNKADLDAAAATRAQAQITSSLRLLGLHGKPHDPHGTEHWQPQVIQLSALQGQGLEDFWAAVSRFRQLQTASGELTQRRQRQALAWMWERIDAGLKQAFHDNPTVKTQLPRLTHEVQAGRLAASTAARNLLLALAQHQ